MNSFEQEQKYIKKKKKREIYCGNCGKLGHVYKQCREPITSCGIIGYQIFKQNIPNVLAEDGCIDYGPTIDMEGVGEFQTPIGPDTYVVIEKWESLDHLMAHTIAPHMKAYASKVRDMLESRSIHVLEGI